MPSEPDEPEIHLLFPDGHNPMPPLRLGRWGVLLGFLFALFLLFHNGVPLYTDWLWFGEVGYRKVFTTTILAKTLLFFLFGGLFFALFYLNARWARRMAPEYADRFLMQTFGPEWGRRAQKYIGRAIFVIALFLSLWAGRLAAEQWTQWLTFMHGAAFGKTDPVFGNDIGFYLFRLPFLSFAYTFLLGSLLITGVAIIAIHVADRAIESWSGLPDIQRGVRAQLLILLGLLALAQAFGTRLAAFDLLTNDNGGFTGAGYADLHYRLLFLNIQTGLLLLTALACFVTIFKGNNFRWPTIGALSWVGVAVLGGVLAAAGEKFTVIPNQFVKESEYIKRNIDFTRQAYGLQNVRLVDHFPADASLTAAGLKANKATLDNVRLWDYPYLGKVYSQLQTIKSYYKFENVAVGGGRSVNIDIDRYPINGQTRQVMLAAREMDTDSLPESARTWQNERLGYTHGYGLVMSPVNLATAGDPDYFLSGFPPAPTALSEKSSLTVSQPDIYYGMLDHQHVYVKTQQKEYDYPTTAGNQDHYTAYNGLGGIQIGDSYLRKLAFAARLGDWNLLLAGNLTSETRILYHRDVRERVMLVAPWIQQDGDPYLVVDPDNGRLRWIIDGYTISDRFPYSTPVSMNVADGVTMNPNYIRNSVKATVDAYDGTVTLYLADPADPIARTYDNIYPGLLKPISQMPAGLRAHLRYPEDLFRVQRSIYATYHVDDPLVFYHRDDAWAIPNEPNPEAATPQSASRQMEPYYVVMRLPELSGGQGTGDRGQGSRQETVPRTLNPEPRSEEFVLMSPLAPVNQEDKNILGWMAARCDGDHYGELVLYRFGQGKAVEGPSQIMQNINSDRVISPKLSLLRSGGSSATFGNVLVIPIEQSLLYITPLYVESSASANKLPRLTNVVVAFNERVAIGDNLDEALAQLFPGYGGENNGETAPPPAQPGTTPPPPNSAGVTVAPQIRALIDRADQQYEAAQQKLKSGDFAGYGAATKQLKQTLEELRRTAR